MLRLRIVRKLARALQAWAIGPPAIAVQSRINVMCQEALVESASRQTVAQGRWLKALRTACVAQCIYETYAFHLDPDIARRALPDGRFEASRPRPREARPRLSQDPGQHRATRVHTCMRGSTPPSSISLYLYALALSRHACAYVSISIYRSPFPSPYPPSVSLSFAPSLIHRAFE